MKEEIKPYGGSTTITDVLEGKAQPCIINADCVETMRAMPANCVDAIVTDPPYG